MTDVFISYKREDRPLAKALAALLVQRGFDVWWDIDLLPGDRFAEEIEAVIRQAKVAIILWSERSVASDFVRAEAYLALQLGILVPARLDTVQLPIPFNTHHTLDLTGWRGRLDDPRLDPLLAAVMGRVGPPESAPDSETAVEEELHQPDAEALYWRTITDHADPSVEEYRAYLKRFGETALFADLAHIRIARLDRQAVQAKRPTFGKVIAGSTAVVGLLAAVMALVPEVRDAVTTIWNDGVDTPVEARGEPTDLSSTEGGVGAAEEPAPSSPFPDEAESGDADALAPLEPFTDDLASGAPCPYCPEMVVIPAGSFLMGSPEDEEGRQFDEGPQREVTVPAFAMGATEVTFAQWDACVADGGCNGYRPDDAGWGRDDRPVIYVSWEDAQGYVDWLSQETGETYRLPSEAEWEYAARATRFRSNETGQVITRLAEPEISTTAFPWGDFASHEFANYGADECCSGLARGRDQWADETAPVAGFPANGFGLYDMHGNVWEWVEDRWHRSYEGAPDDGSAWTTGDSNARVLRGGSWDNDPVILRSANRNGGTPGVRNSDAGFRVARTLTP